MDNKNLNEQTAEVLNSLTDEALDKVTGGQGDGAPFDQDLEMLEFYSEVDRLCMERGIHPTDLVRVREVEEEVRRNRQQ